MPEADGLTRVCGGREADLPQRGTSQKQGCTSELAVTLWAGMTDDKPEESKCNNKLFDQTVLHRSCACKPLGLEAEMRPAVWRSAQGLQLPKPVSQDPPRPDSDELKEPASRQW